MVLLLNIGDLFPPFLRGGLGWGGLNIPPHPNPLPEREGIKIKA